MEKQFRVQCVEAAKQLREDDVKVLSYIYQINVPSTCDTTLSKAIHVFESLEEDGRLRPNGGGEITLQTLLNELPRQDIVFQLFGETKEANVNTAGLCSDLQQQGSIATSTITTNQGVTSQ